MRFACLNLHSGASNLTWHGDFSLIYGVSLEFLKVVFCVGSPFSAGTCRQLYGGVCLIASWGMDISNHDLFGMGVSDCCVGLDVM